MVDVLVVGGGLAGSAVALGLTRRDLKVAVAEAGWGATANFAGKLQLGASPALVRAASALPGHDPAAEVAGLAWHQHLRDLVGHEPLHPYAALGAARTRALLGEALQELAFVGQACDVTFDVALLEGPARPWPTVSGALAPCYVDRSAWPADGAGAVVALDFVHAGVPMGPRAVMGWHHDARRWGVPLGEVRPVTVPAEALVGPGGEGLVGPLALARALDDGAFVRQLAQKLAPHVAGAGAVVMPAVLGLAHAGAHRALLQAAWRCPVEEALADAPHVPGIRLMQALQAARARAGIEVLPAVASVVRAADGAPAQVRLADGRTMAPAACVLATGRFLGGGLRWPQEGRCHEALWHLPATADGGPLNERSALELTRRRPEEAQPIARAGVATDDALRPYDADGRRVERLWAAGTVLGGFCPELTACSDGVALATAQAVVHALAPADAPPRAEGGAS